MKYEWVDRIDSKGNIRTHAVQITATGGKRTLCGLHVFQWQPEGGNARCKHCERRFEAAQHLLSKLLDSPADS